MLEQTTNTAPVSGVEYSCNPLPPLTLPGHSPVQEVDKKAGSKPSDGVYSPIFAYFRVFWPYFRVNSVENSYRNAIINYLLQNKGGKSRCHIVNSTMTTGRTKVYGPLCSPRIFRYFSHLLDNLGV